MFRHIESLAVQMFAKYDARTLVSLGQLAGNSFTDCNNPEESSRETVNMFAINSITHQLCCVVGNLLLMCMVPVFCQHLHCSDVTALQSEDMLRQTQQLTHLIEQSESVILINLDRCVCMCG